jgi:ABC-type lipoprotein export system ATPase subunit
MVSKNNEKNIFLLSNVNKYFVSNNIKVSIFDNVSAVFEQNQTYALMGASGSGKSTLLQLLAGLEPISSGSIMFNQSVLSSLARYEQELFLNRHIGFVFQTPLLLSELSVLENIMIKELMAGKAMSDIREQALILVRLCGLEKVLQTPVILLSGGEQQRVAIARALCNRPTFLFADEPTAHLDTKTRDEILMLLLTVQRDWRMGLIIATHDPVVASNFNHTYEIRDKQLHVVS